MTSSPVYFTTFLVISTKPLYSSNAVSITFTSFVSPPSRVISTPWPSIVYQSLLFASNIFPYLSVSYILYFIPLGKFSKVYDLVVLASKSIDITSLYFSYSIEFGSNAS